MYLVETYERMKNRFWVLMILLDACSRTDEEHGRISWIVLFNLKIDIHKLDLVFVTDGLKSHTQGKVKIDVLEKSELESIENLESKSS